MANARIVANAGDCLERIDLCRIWPLPVWKKARGISAEGAHDFRDLGMMPRYERCLIRRTLLHDCL